MSEDNSELIKRFIISHLKRYIYEINFMQEVIKVNTIDSIDGEFLNHYLEAAELALKDALDFNFEKDMIESTEMFL